MTQRTEINLVKTAERLGVAVEQMPRNIAIIMDGNGRWAQEKGKARGAGHRKGGRIVERTALDCVDLGIESLTLYSFSIENWKRPQNEIDQLMALYRKYLIGIRPMMMKNKVKLVHLGVLDNLPDELIAELNKSIEMTVDNDGMILGFALNYGGRKEILDAAKKIAQEYKDGEITLEDVDEQLMKDHLYTPQISDPDLLIRTAGEMRVSNFLLWQISYSEFFVTDTFWPDFNKANLEEAILTYTARNRRFGNIDTKREV